MPYSEHDKEPHQSTNHCPEKQLEIRVNQCGDERLKVHSSYTLKASLKEGVSWFEAPLSFYRSTKSPHSLVALFLLYLKLSFLARLPFFLISCSPSYHNAPPFITSESSHARVNFSLHLQPTTVIPQWPNQR